MYHQIGVGLDSLDREMLQCYADVHEHGRIEQAVAHISAIAVRAQIDNDPLLAERWQAHLARMADRAARWDSAQEAEYRRRGHGVGCATTAGNS